MVAYIAALMALLGALVYAFANQPKLQELGRITFFCGLLVVTMALGGKTVKLF